MALVGTTIAAAPDWISGHPGTTERSLSITMETRDYQSGLDTARFKPNFGAGWTKAATHAPSSDNYQPRLAELPILWRFTNTGFTSWKNNTQVAAIDAALGITHFNSQEFAPGPFIKRVFKPGTATIELFVYDPENGEYGYATTTKTTTAFTATWTGSQVVAINPTGDSDFSWASGYTGATQVTDNGSNIASEITSRIGSPLAVFFKDGGTFTNCSFAIAESTTSSGIYIGRSNHLGGEANKPIIRIGAGNHFVDANGGWSTSPGVKDFTIDGLRFDPVTKFNPTSDNVYSASFEQGIWSVGAGIDCLIHDVTVDGMAGLLVNAQAGETIETHYHLDDVLFDENQGGGQYPILTADYTHALSSFGITGGRSVRKPTTNATNTDMRANIRVNGATWGVIEAFDLFSTQGGGQPAVKWNEAPGHGTVFNMIKCFVESGRSQAVFHNHNVGGTGGVAGYQSTSTIRGNFFVSGYGGVGQSNNVYNQGVYYDRNVTIVAGLSGGNSAGFNAMLSANQGGTSVASGDAPIRARNNTAAVLRTTIENGSQGYSLLSNPDGYTDVSENGNLEYYPNLDTPVEDHSSLDTTQIITLRGAGEQDGVVFTANLAPDSSDVASYEPSTLPPTVTIVSEDDVWRLPIDGQRPSDILTSGISIGAWQFS